jgi:hypothetical protein
VLAKLRLELEHADERNPLVLFATGSILETVT